MAPSYIGIVVAVAGNVVISLALNIQKLSHLRLDHRDPHAPRDRDDEEQSRRATERTRLLVTPTATSDGGEAIRPLVLPNSNSPRRSSASPSKRISNGGDRTSDAPLAIVVEEPPDQDGDDRDGEEEESGSGSRAYLKSKLWWLGLALMTAGEFANFFSYGFAPASVVAPLGTVALIANCFLAPLLLKESFRWKDAGGILLSILGALTVVFSSKQSDVEYSPDQLKTAIVQPPFITYAIINATCILALAWLSTREAGKRWIFVDLGVCALAGGFTVLSTKAISTFFRMFFFDAFRVWLLYPLAAVLAINFLNRALQRFDSREVVPAQFVLFTISAIVGSALLYREFEDIDIHQALNFFFGCAIVFGGVYLLTRGDEDKQSPTTPVLRAMPIDQALNHSNLQDGSIRAVSLPSLSSGDVPILRSRQSSETIRYAPRTIAAGYMLLSASPGTARSWQSEARSSGQSAADEASYSPSKPWRGDSGDV